MGKFLKIFGNLISTVGGILACTCASAAMLMEGRMFGARIFWVGAIFWGLLAFAGLRMRRQGRLKTEEAESIRYKQALNVVARRNQGRVTALELATALGVDVEQARAYLQLLVGLGEATPELTEQFTQYYQIGGVLSAGSLPPPPPPPPPPPSPVRPVTPARQAPPTPPPLTD